MTFLPGSAPSRAAARSHFWPSGISRFGKKLTKDSSSFPAFESLQVTPRDLEIIRWSAHFVSTNGGFPAARAVRSASPSSSVPASAIV